MQQPSKEKYCGFVRVAAASIKTDVANVTHNVKEIIEVMEEANSNGAYSVVFPELCITGYSCGDLFFTDALLDAAISGLSGIAMATREFRSLKMVVVGLPVRVGQFGIMNVAAVVSGGNVLGLVPKSYLPNYKEFYEGRQFTSGRVLPSGATITLGASMADIPIGTDILFRDDEMAMFWGTDVTVGVEICEDLWTPIPPSSYMALRGATIIMNPSASNELVGKAEYRAQLVAQQSARCIAAYVYASAGQTESTTDVVYSGDKIIAYNGSIRARSTWNEGRIIYADVDVQRLVAQRTSESSFADAAAGISQDKRLVCFKSYREPTSGIMKVNAGLACKPFVPAGFGPKEAMDIIRIQKAGLLKRVQACKAKTMVLGLSGGLDSTLAAIVCAEVQRSTGGAVKLHAISMPGFGTSDRTRVNAKRLAKMLEAEFEEISIEEECKLHMSMIGVPEYDRSVVFENIQARVRTEVLMNKANALGGIVVGTGDLSELALGWCTYNADHMSMYSVNCSIPKTLVRSIVGGYAEWVVSSDAAIERGYIDLQNTPDVLQDILDTPVSPELLPPGEDGTIQQKTEDILGAYELHDFFLYHFIKYGACKSKLLAMARVVFEGVYDNEEIDRTLCTFIRRFVQNQFKRSCMPDGPKVGSISLSPRGDWRMPSDASFETLNS